MSVRGISRSGRRAIRTRYFRAAERYERVNGVAFEEWKVTLPQELSHRQNLALTRDLVDAIAGTRLPDHLCLS